LAHGDGNAAEAEALLIAAFQEDLCTGDPTVTAQALARLDTPRAAEVLCAALATLGAEKRAPRISPSSSGAAWAA